MFLAGISEIDLTRALSQKVTSVVPTVTYLLITVTQNVLRKTKFVTTVVRKVITHVVVGQRVQIVPIPLMPKVKPE